MKKTDKPSMYFVGAVLRAFDEAEGKVQEDRVLDFPPVIDCR